MEHQEQTTQITIEAQEEERKRISKDLHNGIGQELSGLKMAWDQLTKRIQLSSPTDASSLENLSKILNESINNVRDISHQMMSRSLQDLGLVSAVDDTLLKSFSDVGIECSFGYYGIKGRFPEKIEVGLYRVY